MSLQIEPIILAADIDLIVHELVTVAIRFAPTFSNSTCH